MNIALINIPIRAPWLGQDAWVTVPPQGYGGIQWVNAMVIDGLTELGHKIFLLGAPGSISTNTSLEIVPAGTSDEICAWLRENEVDIVHDSSNSAINLRGLAATPFSISTHHFTGMPNNPSNTVYLSYAQRQQAKATPNAPIIRIPVNPTKYIFSREKQEYLLFLGRISRWKGALEAAAFAKAAGMTLVLAGPSWEEDYLQDIIRKFGNVVHMVGEVGGNERLTLLAGAKALLALSQPVTGPWGDVWCEPGATVVSEAAVSGTPVISTDNGCLAEITPQVGCVLHCGESISSSRAREIIRSLPSPDAVFEAAVREWGYIKIAREYEALYIDVIGGKKWH